MRTSTRLSVAVIALCALTIARSVDGGPIDYTVDSTLSSLQVAIYIGGSPANGGTLLTAPQSPGSDITSLGGTLSADVGGGTVNFPGGSSITFANQPLDQEPAVGGGASPGDPGAPAPANYGLNVILVDSGPVALRDAIADVTSPGGPIALVAGTFDTSLTVLGTTAGSADYNLTGLFATAGSSSLAGQSGPNDPGVGTVSMLGSLTTITIPISVNVPIAVGGLVLDAIFTGQIVASATAVPEPSTLLLAAVGLMGIVSVKLRRRNR